MMEGHQKCPRVPVFFPPEFGRWPLKEVEGATGRLLGFIRHTRGAWEILRSQKKWHPHRVYLSSVNVPKGLGFGGGF